MKKLLIGIIILTNIVLAVLIISDIQNNDQSLWSNKTETTSNESQVTVTGHLKIEEKRSDLCLIWSIFALDNLETYSLQMTKLDSLFKFEVDIDEANWWVYVPPQRSLDAMNAKVDLLRSAGFDAFPNTSSGKMRWSISLGRFALESSAREFIALIKSSGIDRIVLNKDSKVGRRIFVKFSGIHNQPKESLKILQDTFPSSELREFQCGNI